MKKQLYLDLMEKTLSAYSDEYILRFFERVQETGLTEHGFPRVVANLGILIAHGKKQNLIPLFCRMMEFCCKGLPTVQRAGGEFAVKELIFCILELEQTDRIPAETIAGWKALLATLDPYKNYKHYAKSPEEDKHNWCCFALVSEYMRQYIGIADTEDAVAIQIPTQLRRFDQNGQYRDPGNPMVYDLVPRGLFSVLLHFGYRGEFYQEIDRNLRRAALLTLQMQSVSGEIPFGGRSGQFLHNEPHMALIMEYEATRYAKEGNLALAAEFKRGAQLAMEHLQSWLACEPMRHVKNYFPLESSYGCDGYGYFDKYMITVASFLYVAYLFCDDSIEPSTAPMPSVATMTSEYFHKAFLRAGEYFAEIDTDPDRHHDATGLGRLHKKGAPSALCLSMPATATPKYTVDRTDLMDLSLCPGTRIAGEWHFATEKGVTCRADALSKTEDTAHATLTYDFLEHPPVKVEYDLDKRGMQICVLGEGELSHMLPAFLFDGETENEIILEGNTLTLSYHGWSCRYTVTGGEIRDTGRIACNRNGYYRAFCAYGQQELKILIEIFPQA